MVLIKELQDSKSWTLASFIQFPLPWKKWAGLEPEIPGLKSGPTPALHASVILWSVVCAVFVITDDDGNSKLVVNKNFTLNFFYGRKLKINKNTFYFCFHRCWVHEVALISWNTRVVVQVNAVSSSTVCIMSFKSVQLLKTQCLTRLNPFHPEDRYFSGLFLKVLVLNAPRRGLKDDIEPLF